MKLCRGTLSVYEHKDTGIHWYDAILGVRPSGLRRKRLTCPKCGRRMMSSVKTCEDGCCLYHTLPAHKPKGWWKKPKKHWIGGRIAR